jgi:hypothetical protein
VSADMAYPYIYLMRVQSANARCDAVSLFGVAFPFLSLTVLPPIPTDSPHPWTGESATSPPPFAELFSIQVCPSCYVTRVDAVWVVRERAHV